MTEHPATALDALAALRGEITGSEADSALASYFAPGPEPRYDTPELQAEAEAGPGSYVTKISVPSFDDGTQRMHNHMREPEDEPEPQA